MGRHGAVHSDPVRAWVATARAFPFALWRLPVPGTRRERSVLAVAHLCTLAALLVLSHATPPAVDQPDGAVASLFTPEGAGGNGPVKAAPPPVDAAPSPASSERVRSGRQPARSATLLLGIPEPVLRGYDSAVREVRVSLPGCRFPSALLAAIGKVESGHARGGDVDATGTTRSPIIGPRLDGTRGTAAIPDTDGGAYDGDGTWDHAVGPMQFIPSTWRRWAADGNADGATNPHNIYDASLASARYLCTAGGDLSTPQGLRRAVLAYNHSERYLALVLAWMRAYSAGVVPVAVVAAAGHSAVDTRRERRSRPRPEPAERHAAAPRERTSGPAPGAPRAAPPALRPSSPPRSPAPSSTPVAPLPALPDLSGTPSVPMQEASRVPSIG